MQEKSWTLSCVASISRSSKVRLEMSCLPRPIRGQNYPRTNQSWSMIEPQLSALVRFVWRCQGVFTTMEKMVID